MDETARILFSAIDKEVDRTTAHLRNRMLATLKDLPWTPSLRAAIGPLVRDELERLVQGLLGVFNNVGGVLPDGAPVYEITAIREATTSDISSDGTDYADLWYEYLIARHSDFRSEGQGTE